ncbi:MAG: SLC13 family permease [Fidelibacterota bacterium]
MLGFSHQSLANFLFWVTQKKWFLITLFIGLVLLLLPTPQGLSVAGYRTIIIAITALIMIVKEPIPLPAIALYILVLEVYFDIDSPDGIAHSFMNDAVFFIMGSLMLAVAIVKQGWDTRIALGIIRITGNKTSRIVFGFTAISAVLSSFIGMHTVAALMLPIAMTLIKYTSDNRSKIVGLSGALLFAIAYGSLLGSIGTPSGGGRNAIMMSYFQQFHIDLSYIQWILLVYPLLILEIPVIVWLLLRDFKPEVSQLDSSVRKLVIQVAKSETFTGRNTVAIFIFFLIFAGWVFLSDIVGLGTIALTGVLLYLIAGFVKWEDLNQKTHWGVIILFGSTISLGVNIKSTGAAFWLADHLVNMIANLLHMIPYITDIMVVLMTTALANVLSSTATVAVLAPVTLNMGPDTLHLGLVTAIASSFGFFTAVAAPACTIIYSSGLVQVKDFLKAGWKVGLFSMVLIVIYANTYWMFFN